MVGSDPSDRSYPVARFPPFVPSKGEGRGGREADCHCLGRFSTAILPGGKQSDRRRRERCHHAEPGRRPRTGAVSRPARRARQIVGLGRRGQQEECVQFAQPLAVPRGRPARRRYRPSSPPFVKRGNPAVSALVKVGQFAELNRLGRARFGAGRFQPAFQPIVTQRAFMRLAVFARTSTTPNGQAGGNRRRRCRCPADDDGVELVAEQRAGRTGFMAAARRAMFADIAHHQPALWKALSVDAPAAFRYAR